MTLRQPNIDRMLQLGFTGMAEALEEQADIANIDQLGFDDRLAMMLEREAEHRDQKSYLGHLRQAAYPRRCPGRRLPDAASHAPHSPSSPPATGSASPST